MTVLDVSGIDFGRTKEISEVRGTSLKFNLEVRWQSQGVIYAVRPLNGSPVNIIEFSPKLVCALILWISGLGLLMGKFRQIFTELSAQDMPIFSFPDDNLSK